MGSRLRKHEILLLLVAACWLFPSTTAWSSGIISGGPPQVITPIYRIPNTRPYLTVPHSRQPPPSRRRRNSFFATLANVDETQSITSSSDSIDEASAALDVSSSSGGGSRTTNAADAGMDAEIKLLAQQILNALFLAVCFGWAAYTIFNIDDGMTRGWTQGEIAMRIPLDNWSNYERSLQDKPIFTKTLINVVIYLLGDWLSQTVFQKKNILDFDVSRTLKNGFIGLCFGPLVHQYYQFSDTILPVEGGIMNRVEKILMDQTIYLTVKCSIYIFAVGFLSGDDFNTCKTTVKEKIGGIVLTAWKFWPLVHCVTYGLIPARHRILWVNSVDLIWNAILASKAQKGDVEKEAQVDEEIRESAHLAIDSHDPLAKLTVHTSLASIKETIDEEHHLASDNASVRVDHEPVIQEVYLTGSSVEVSDEGVLFLVADNEEHTVVPIEEPAEEGVDISSAKENSTTAIL